MPKNWHFPACLHPFLMVPQVHHEVSRRSQEVSKNNAKVTKVTLGGFLVPQDECLPPLDSFGGPNPNAIVCGPWKELGVDEVMRGSPCERTCAL